MLEMEQIPPTKIQLFCAPGRFHLTLIPTFLVGILTWSRHHLEATSRGVSLERRSALL